MILALWSPLIPTSATRVRRQIEEGSLQDNWFPCNGNILHLTLLAQVVSNRSWVVLPVGYLAHIFELQVVCRWSTGIHYCPVPYLDRQCSWQSKSNMQPTRRVSVIRPLASHPTWTWFSCSVYFRQNVLSEVVLVLCMNVHSSQDVIAVKDYCRGTHPLLSSIPTYIKSYTSTSIQRTQCVKHRFA